MTHLYFISIHPFEEGNGRYIPSLTALSQIIQDNQKFIIRH
jgi:hypothetical protein